MCIKASFVARTAELFALLRQHPSFAPGEPTALLAHIQDSDTPAVYNAVDTLLGDDSDSRATVIHGFVSGHGDFEGLPCMPLSCPSVVVA